MKISEILEDRNFGYFKIQTRSTYGASMEEIMESFGLFPVPEDLREIEENQATEILATILWKDLAYRVELVPKSLAVERASFICGQFSRNDTKFYTNGNWENYHEMSGCSFNNLTEATLDAGVLFVNSKSTACVWVQDED